MTEKDIQEFEAQNIAPYEMPAFLNEVASEYFKDKPEIRAKIAQCSFHLFVCNKMLADQTPIMKWWFTGEDK